MKMSELILAIGDDNVEFQNLDQCLAAADYSHKKGTTITFATGMRLHPSNGTEKLGIILWLDRDAVKAAVSKEGAA